ncbi:bromodomain-containing protein 4B isoform X3 [Drosophila miranda]|uniref:bromodomain-containing protein 4B isoform X3 n=1 Tax=Drosophila miranda TaxID=7229 RepID=UPI00143F9B4E|nr:bromodomain-containing protein 4B isoform X3 [Drosophila miranda]
MAALQRKLVHKQFNSPMGLYSQENVKATLNRELKAFGGEGIEVDDQIAKPLNLANSAVLRAVEEEEQQAKCDFYPQERQSRTRQRDGDGLHHTLHQQLLDQIKTHYLSHQQDITIDRDTVLKINRMATKRHMLKRDHSWPPTEAEAVAITASSPDLSHIPSCASHSIEALREKFQSPTMIIEPTAKQVREQRQREGSKERPITPLRTTELQLAQVFHQTPVAKGFSAPETKAADVDLGLVAPRCEYYEQLAHKRPTTPTTLTITPYRPRPKRQAYSLDRGRSRKRTVAAAGAPELPPPKPRSTKVPKVQRRCIKLATEVKISYDNEADSEEEDKPKPKVATSQEVDLEAVPLPPIPREAQAAAAQNEGLPRKSPAVIDSLAVKRQQQMALALASTSTGTGRPSQSPSQELGAGTAATRIIPVRVEASGDLQLQPSAQQIYDDACTYLQQDQQEMEDSSNVHAPCGTTYVSATSGIKLLQRQASVARTTTNSNSAPTPPPPPPPPMPVPPKMRPKSGEESVARAKQARRQGGVYSTETATESEAEKQHEAHVEISQLEAKYAHIQQSIAEHLRQIDTYMENAKMALQRSVQTTPVPTVEGAVTATPPPPPPPPPPPAPASLPIRPDSGHNELWDMFSSRQSPILAVESPLQAILRQIYCRASGRPGSVAKEESIAEAANEEITENVPIVERALEDLHRIALALDKQQGQPQPDLAMEQHQKQDLEKLLQVEHMTTPAAVKAQHVVIEDEEEDAEDAEDAEYRHVSDVIANYEQLSTGKPPQQETKQDAKPDAEPESQRHKEEEQKEDKEKDEQCPHQDTTTDHSICCPVCNELRYSPNNWSKLTKADQWRIANLHNEPMENYKATYEIRSPYISRQISWEDTQSAEEKSERTENQQPEKLQRQRSFVEIVTTRAPDSPPPPAPPPPPPLRLNLPAAEITWQRSRSPSPLSSRKYPAPLIEAPHRASSPFGLNPVIGKMPPAPSPSPLPLPPTALESKFSHVPQLEGHNIGLLVRTATEPLQQSMVASSSLLASTPPATPRSARVQPSPFDFSVDSSKFRSLAASEDESEPSRQPSVRDFNVNRSFDNVSPRPYLGIEGYKRVAWPPASEERIIREFTPQPQTQSPAPGAGGYYPQPTAAAPQPSAVPAQGPIYNNVQPRSTPTPQPRATQQQVQAQAPQQQFQYGSTPAQGPVPSQYPDQSYPHDQQPVQYTQAQFNRQSSRELVQAPAPAAASDAYPNYQSNYQRQPSQEPLMALDNTGGGWKPIRAPLPKSHHDYTPAGGAPYQGSAPQQQQRPAYLQQQPQYGSQQQQQQPQPQPQSVAPQWQQQQPAASQQPAPQWQQQQQQQPAPQWQQQQYQAQPLAQAQAPYQAPAQPSYQTSPYQQAPPQQHQQQQPSYYPQQNGGSTYAQPQYNSYSQPQQQQQQLPYSQDQTDQQQQQQHQVPVAFAGQDAGYRGASPGIITLRKEAPVSQQSAPVYTSQPAAVSYQGGSKLRGDLKWPPPEYKEAAARENEERRQLALGPVCRPRKVNRDYTSFFAKHQLNNAYPSYKVPPGTQHMFA